ncbi:MAG: hypothetical protein K0U98_08375 [Deltaproteobacteria bacterium]|nr:hypothetical protein [Deltaproteobacteria bacterium]
MRLIQKQIPILTFLVLCVTFFSEAIGAQPLEGAPLPQGIEQSLESFEVEGGVVRQSFLSVDRQETLFLRYQFGPTGPLARGQIFSSDGNPIAAPFDIPDFPRCWSHFEGVSASLTEAEFLLLWSEQDELGGNNCDLELGGDALARRFSRQGVALAEEFQLNTNTAQANTFPNVGVFPNGELVFSWSQMGPEFQEEITGYRSRQMVRRFSADGMALGPEVQVSDFFLQLSYDGGVSRILPGDQDDFLLIWESYGDEPSFQDVSYRRIGIDGTLLSAHSWFGRDTEDGDDSAPQQLGDAVRLPNGEIVVTWALVGNFDKVVVERLDVMGNLLPGRVELLPDMPMPIGFRPSLGHAYLAVRQNGDYLVAWTDHTGRDGDESGVFARWYSVEGFPISEDFQVNSRFKGDQNLRSIIGGEEPLVLLNSRSLVDGFFERTTRALRSRCSSSPNTLCLGEDGRFRVEVAWADLNERDGQGGAEALSSESGYFWFFRPENVELVVKVVDGGAVNGNFWVFYGALSNVEYQLTVTDTQAGIQKVYRSPARTFSSVGDTAAFPGEAPLGATARGIFPAGGSLSPEALAALLPEVPGEEGPVLDVESIAGTTGDLLEFEAGRFAASLSWRDFSGNTGIGHGVSLTTDTGYFWFFNPVRAEVVLKVLDGRAVNGHFWVFYGALSNVEYTLSIEDRLQETTRTYFNPSGTFASQGDTEAFP